MNVLHMLIYLTEDEPSFHKMFQITNQKKKKKLCNFGLPRPFSNVFAKLAKFIKTSLEIENRNIHLKILFFKLKVCFTANCANSIVSSSHFNALRTGETDQIH